jgi:predicted dehydrogenase
LISGRTADNPRLLTECIAHGANCIYLEKPGAPTVKELEQMAKEAEAAGVKVIDGVQQECLQVCGQDS